MNTSISIEQLAELSFGKYQQSRTTAASELNITLTELDQKVKALKESQNMTKAKSSGLITEDTPIECEVIGTELLNEIKAHIDRYTVLEEAQSIALSLWVTFTYLHSEATVSPILNISSPEKRCGKSTLLTLVSKLSCKSLIASNITSASLFRAIEKWYPTLLIDEADTFLSKNEDMRGILNAGHYRDTAFVIRCDGEDNDPAQFSTWCPKVISGIGNQSETIMDRSVIIEMKRKLPTQTIDSIRRANSNIFLELRRKLAKWALVNISNFINYNCEDITGLNDRAKDNWEPLLAIANVVGDDWYELAKSAAIELSGSNQETPSIGEELLGDVVAILNNLEEDRITTEDLISKLCLDDEKAWLTFNRGKRITPSQLSNKLKPFNIKPSTIRFNEKIKKGYYQMDFVDVIERYIPVPHIGA